MQRVKTTTAVGTKPAYTVNGTPGYFTNGDPAAAVPATVPGQDWFNLVQEELVNLVTGAGLIPSGVDETQVCEAVVKLSLDAMSEHNGSGNAHADIRALQLGALTEHDHSNAAHPGLRVQVPILAFFGSDQINEGESTTLIVRGYVPGVWPIEAAFRITDTSGADVTAQFAPVWTPATGVIRLTAPLVAASGTYQVSAQLWEHGIIRSGDWSESLTLLVADVPVHQPTITAPAAGATNQGATPTLQSSAYAADGGQTHVASQWQVSLSPDVSSPSYDSGQDAAHLVACPIPGGSSLLANKHYYCRVRHKGSGGDWSPWSIITDFFTSVSFVYVSTPSITSPASGATNIGETPTIEASAFATNGAGSHLNADWQIDSAAGTFTTPVHQSLADAAHKTSYPVPSGVLQPNTAYKARVRYRDTTGTPVVSDWSSPVSFTTAVNFLTPWATWDEGSETSLAHPDTFVVLLENPTAGGNETGAGGGLSGTDLACPQGGNLPGATGTPPRRTFIPDNSQFVELPTAAVAMLKRSIFTVVLKHGPVPSNTNLGLLRLDLGPEYSPSAGVGSFAFMNYDPHMISMYASGGRWDEMTISGFNATYANKPFWVALWADGTTLRGGVASKKPTKLSDFDAYKAFTVITPADFAVSLLGGAIRKINHYSYGGGGGTGGDYYYLVISRECLINNAA